MLQYECVPFPALRVEQLYEILALRQEVFIVEQNCPYLDADGRDQAALHLMGRDEQGRLVTYTRILPQGVSYPEYASIGRVITSQLVRGQGRGRELMERSKDELFRHFGGPQPIKIGAQAHLREFYRSVGYEPTGEAYLEDGIPHIGMIRKP